MDRIEQDLELLKRIAEGYRMLWEKNPERIRRIDANGDEKFVQLQLMEELRKYVKRKCSCQ